MLGRSCPQLRGCAPTLEGVLRACNRSWRRLTSWIFGNTACLWFWSSTGALLSPELGLRKPVGQRLSWPTLFQKIGLQWSLANVVPHRLFPKRLALRLTGAPVRSHAPARRRLLPSSGRPPRAGGGAAGLCGSVDPSAPPPPTALSPPDFFF